MMSYPAVVVHGLADARTALAPGRPLTFLSAPGAALYAGVGFWRHLVSMAAASRPDVPLADILDCADAPGRAVEALAAGQRALVLCPALPAFAEVDRLAASLGATVLIERPPALDLASPGSQRRLAAWLAGARG